MNEFKKRLKYAIKFLSNSESGMFMLLIVLSFVVFWLVETFKVVSLFFSILFIFFVLYSLFYIVYHVLKFVYWLFIEPFIKK